MLEILEKTLKELITRAPFTILLVFALWYLYNDLKEVRKELKEVYKLRIQDIKKVSDDQESINDTLEEIVKEVDHEDEE